MTHPTTDTKHPATTKRGGDPDIKKHPARDEGKDKAERKLEQGLEESMAGSDPVSITQPAAPAKAVRPKPGSEKGD
jgi:hypothetical protein